MLFPSLTFCPKDLSFPLQQFHSTRDLQVYMDPAARREQLSAKLALFTHIGVISATRLKQEVTTGAPWEDESPYGLSPEAVYFQLDWLARFDNALWRSFGKPTSDVSSAVLHFEERITNEPIAEMSDKRVALLCGFLDTLLTRGLYSPRQAFAPIADITYRQAREPTKATEQAIMNHHNRLKIDDKVIVEIAESAVLGFKRDDALFVRMKHADHAPRYHEEPSPGLFWAWRARDAVCMFRGAAGMHCIVPNTISAEQYLLIGHNVTPEHTK